MSSLNTLFPNSPPRFDPHITITSNLVIDRAAPHDDVDRILSASAVAFDSFAKDHSHIVTLGRVDSQRKFFKKLYFQAKKDPNLLSLTRIIRELFVILPSKIEKENQKENPHLYTNDSHGNLVKRKPSKKDKTRNPAEQHPLKELDISRLREEAAIEAAEWTLNEFDPHLSLVYSDIYPIDSALWRTIKTRIQDYLNINECDAEDLEDNGLSWDGGVLKLVLTEGDVNDWIVLGSVEVH
ncbi:2, 3 cyclic phosphodiesterase [Yamadazyma tenuis ATCC 10573]|uniref:2',3'-cyclic-nucleotide 3'-phosphodiesterase n=2 Tax=Candida tenuis TaxID=2315449 RepID=G3B832_CANTC|nr:2, 3 cyclic phosphodiesterase [Yamadazyma tenuis ATCC 10573]EGV62339.1 2, 3 cyclic phosphodiesterase [Yamadazyma tenuis ATCC 10573]